jgi:putative membrane protein
MDPDDRLPLILLVATGLVFLLLGWAPKADRFTWFMECFPVLLGAPLLVASRRRFPFTPLLYVLMALHALVLMVGGHWTYAEVPAGHWVKDWLHLARNPYDRLGHLFQGFVPVLLFREVLFRKSILKPGGWSAMVLVFMVLGLSAAYELLEWLTAVATGAKADAFLGTQGDPWDTQWDMACALIGGSLALLLVSRVHDRQMAALPAAPASAGPGGPPK